MFPRFLSSIISWRSVGVLGLLACLLQMTNVVLSGMLKLRKQTGDGINGLGQKVALSSHHGPVRRQDHHLGQKLSDDRRATLLRIARWSVLDSTGEYRLTVGVLRGAGTEDREDAPESRGLTLVTQCHFDKLHQLPLLATRWQGPISIAVFALSGEVHSVVETFHQLRRCHPEVRQNVTFSLVFPLNSPTPPRVAPSSPPAMDASPCDGGASTPPGVLRANYEIEGVQYPNNLLRNVARKATATPLVMVVDVDVVPSEGLHASFLTYAERNGIFDSPPSGDKTAWVVPVYEVLEGVDVPHTRRELLREVQNGTARPFYVNACFHCQRYTDYKAWEKAKEGTAGQVEPLYEVLWKYSWEPFYIGRNNVPLYDERFRQFGFNRISQVCELHVAGYKFLVLDSAFLVHQGFKHPNKFHKTKDLELERNRILFRQFKEELKDKYPESSRKCH